MNKTFYFQHDYDAANDDKILQIRSEFGLEGYSLWWMSLETMAKNEDGHLVSSLIGGLSIGYGVDKSLLQNFLEYCVTVGLMKKDKVGYFTLRMLEHKKQRKAMSEGGKKGAIARWSDDEVISPPISPPYAKEKKRKENKVKEKEIKIEKKLTVGENLQPEVVQPEAAGNSNSILDIFYEINKTIDYAKPFERKAAEKLIDKFGYNTVLNVSRFAVQIRGMAYAPRISSPTQLWDKWADLEAFALTKKNEFQNKQVVDISNL